MEIRIFSKCLLLDFFKSTILFLYFIFGKDYIFAYFKNIKKRKHVLYNWTSMKNVYRNIKIHNISKEKNNFVIKN